MVTLSTLMNIPVKEAASKTFGSMKSVTFTLLIVEAKPSHPFWFTLGKGIKKAQKKKKNENTKHAKSPT